MGRPGAMSKADAIEKVVRRIVSVSTAEPYLNILVYGPNGAGKTRFAATAPNLLIIDVAERGTRSARKSGADVFHARVWEDVTHAYWYLREGNHNYESVAIDTLTNLQHACMRHVLGEQEDRDPNRPVAMPDQRSWGKMGELMKPLILNFRNLPMHTIFVAQERRVDNEETGDSTKVPDLSPAPRGIAMGAVDIIGRMYQREVRSANKKTGKEVSKWEPRLVVGPREGIESKDRTGALGSVVRNPTIPEILEVSQNGK